MNNPFLDYGEEISGGLRRRLRISAGRRERAIARKKLEEEILLDLWQREHRDQIKALLNGPHGAAAKELIVVLEKLPSDTNVLLATFESGPWLRCDENTKYHVLHLINQAIVHHREARRLPPFDDPIDGLSVFLIIRGMLYGNTHNYHPVGV